MAKKRKKKKKGDKHSFDSQTLNAHQQTGTTENGACLTGHEGTFKDGVSCSYRWQARERADEQEDRGWYNFPAYEKVTIERCYTAFAVTRKPGGMKAPRTSLTAPSAAKRDWDVKYAGNFSDSTVKPYYYEAHHIIPKSLFNRSIYDAAKQMREKQYRTYKLIRLSLLEAEYNINHKENMVILPQDRSVSIILRLPIHTVRPHHRDYDLYVKQGLSEVMMEYAQNVAESIDECKDPPSALAKEKLIRLSRDTRKRIRIWGKTYGGEHLERLAIAQILGEAFSFGPQS